MKIAIIADIHDNLVNLAKCLEWCVQEEVQELICLGDITNSETLKIMAESFKNTIHLVRGNIEIYNEKEIEKYSHIKYYGRRGRLAIEERYIGVCHEPRMISEVLEMGRCDIIFYGHTHKPWLGSKGEIKLVNPGTLGGMFQKATFAVWDTKDDNLELKILEEMSKGTF